MNNEKESREKYLRVTNVLYPFSGLQNIDPSVVAYAAARGTKVHKICEGIISGIGEFDIDEEVWGYVESFKKWWRFGHDIVQMEQRFWDDDLKITGQVDLIINHVGNQYIMDLKTSSAVSKTWKAQGCAYAYLANKSGYNITKIGFLHLNKHGKEPVIIEYDPDPEFFLEILRVYNHFYRGKDESNRN